MNALTANILEISQAAWFQPALLVTMVAVAGMAVRKFWRKARRTAGNLVAILAFLGVTPAMMTAWVTNTVAATHFPGVTAVTPVSNGFFNVPSQWTTVTTNGEELLCNPSIDDGAVDSLVCDYQLLEGVNSVESTDAGFFETFTVTTDSDEFYSCEDAGETNWKCPTDRRVFENKEVTS